MRQTFIAFDFETTGFHPMTSEIIEIGAVRFDAKGNVLGTFEQLIKPAFGIKQEAQAVNGISEAMVANCPSLDMVMPQFMMFLGAPEQNILIAHNAANFDIKFLAMACARTGLPLPDHRIVDSIDLCIRCMPKPHNLKSVCQRLGINTRGAHRALADAMAVMRLTLLLGSKHPGSWKTLPVYYAEEFGIEPIDVPIEFEEWEACCDPCQKVEIVYAGGSRPGEPRVVIPKGFFEYKGREFMTAYCLLDDIHKTFEVGNIISVELPDEDPETMARKVKMGLAAMTPEALEELAQAQKMLESMKLGGAPSNPKVLAVNKAPPQDKVGTLLAVCLGVVAIVLFGGALALFGWLVDEVGESGAFLLIVVALVVGVVVISVVNTMNGFIDSILGPRR